ncbi:MAG: hypothetical protein HRU46_10635 [Verrucomicrobiales bacterium]|nr:hypothetical protein [Verrucomicrobiales bacterium]
MEKDESTNDWWGELFSWIGGITGDVDTDAAEMGALGNVYGGSAGDGNNGHGNDPDGFDSSNPGKGREKSQ